MERRIALGVLAAVLVVGASGCGSGSKFKVGLATNTGGLNDRGLNHLADVGLQRAQAQLGVKTRVVTSNTPADYIPSLGALAKQGYKLVIAVGPPEIGALKAVAKQYPKTQFAIVDVSDGDEGGLPNVEGLVFREQEAGYLVGYAAGLAAKQRGGHAVSSVGGKKQPAVDRYIAGFQAGAKAADPGVTTLNDYSQDLDNQAKCKELALQQIAAGSVVVFQVAGGCGLGALAAAKEKGVWGVGVDTDQGYLGSYVLTSAVKRVDTAVYDAIRDAKSGESNGGQDAIYGVNLGGVDVGRFSPKAPPGIAAKVERVKKEIAAGKITNIPTTVN